MPARLTSLAASALLFAGLACPYAASAAEGMWTLDNLPRKAMEDAHGFRPDARWLERAMQAPVRLTNGCSGSFVARNGLVLTNHHCIRDCVQDLSTAETDYIASGFHARTRGEERRCADIELNRLRKITDVTPEIRAATAGAAGEAFTPALNAAVARLTAACVGKQGETVVCEVVPLYGGGLYHLYRYDRFKDVRLVFAPEQSVAFFGGDPDNFNFPRYNLDMGLLRAYRDGRPVVVMHYFPLKPAGPEEGELTITLGHPGSTDRQLTVAQLLRRRDADVIPVLLRRAEIRGVLTEFGREDPERRRVAAKDLLRIENSYKADRGYLDALLNPALMAAKEAEERDLQVFVAGDPARQAAAGTAWGQIEHAQAAYRALAPRWKQLERGAAFYSAYFDYARILVRGAADRVKPDSQRLPEFAAAELPALEQRLASTAPIDPALEQVKLGWSLTQMRELLGADDPVVARILKSQSPEEVARKWVAGTRLGDPAVRLALWRGGQSAVDASTDTMVVLARDIDDEARALRSRYEAEVESVERRNADRIAAARFARSGTGTYPDATFTLRLSYGEVRGWTEGGRTIAPFTDFAGAFRRNTGAEPYRLPPSWARREAQLPADQRFNFVTTNDIVGGNSGSPVINRNGELVGVAFDGNIHSLGGDLWYDPALNRAVSVHAGAMLRALTDIYDAGELAREMQER